MTTRFLNRGLVFTAGISILLGLALYRLSAIPFGPLFDWILMFFALFLASALLLLGIRIVRSRRVWLKWLALIPWVMAPTLLVLAAAVIIDVRIFYFQGVPPEPSSEAWVEDLRFLAAQTSEKHRDLDALIPRDRWDAAVEEIASAIPSLSEADVVMELFRLSALPNDNHSFPFVMAPCFRLHSFPFVVYGFPEGWHIVNAGRGYEDVIGARIVRIGSRSVEDIYQQCPLLLAAENEWSRKERFTYVVVMAEWLAYHGIIDDITAAEFTVELADGSQRVLAVPSVQFNRQFRWSGLEEIANDAPPVYINPREDAYTYRLVAGGKVLYIQLNQCMEQEGGPTPGEFAHSISGVLEDPLIERCIIDLRNNDGGNDVFDALLEVLEAQPVINRRGHLFSLIGRRTQSAAVRFATALQMRTAVLFVGEPTGQGPIFYGGPTLVELPHSGLLFGVSTHLAVAGFSFDARSALEPDIPTAYGIGDFREGRDPVLNVALSYLIPERETETVPQEGASRYVGRYLADDRIVLDIGQDDGGLTASITDFLPATRQNFRSDLRWESGGRFSTKLPDVDISFPGRPTATPPEAVLVWRGTQLTFTRLPEDATIAFELLSRGDVLEGCMLIRNENERYRRIYPELERLLNRQGYLSLRGGETVSALTLFALNVELFPESFNVYDSYGEALMVDGKIDSAIASYRRSLALNPENGNAARVIERLSDL